MALKVFIGADHKGFELKNKLIDWLNSNGYEAQDCGPFEYDKDDDFVDFAAKVGNQAVKREGSRGIVICGSGAGADITANKIKGVRCSIGFEVEQVGSARKDDDLNVLAIASSFTEEQKVVELVKTFLQTEYDPTERHQRRIEKVRLLEN